MAFCLYVGDVPLLFWWLEANLHDGRALLGTLVFGSLAIVLPTETPVSKDDTMDWVGSALGISAFIMFNFVWKYVPVAALPFACHL